MLHQVTNVTELGWEPATESRPEQSSQDKKLKRKYLLTTKKSDGTVVRGIPAAADLVEANVDKRVLAAAQKAFFSALRNRM